MALQVVSPENETQDIGIDDFIRDIRDMWIKYADPKYIDLLDVDHVPTIEEGRTDTELDITIPEITIIRPLIVEDEE